MVQWKYYFQFFRRTHLIKAIKNNGLTLDCSETLGHTETKQIWLLTIFKRPVKS